MPAKVCEEQKWELNEEHLAVVGRPFRYKLEFSLLWSPSKSYEGDFFSKDVLGTEKPICSLLGEDRSSAKKPMWRITRGILL